MQEYKGDEFIMKHLIRLTDMNIEDLWTLFRIADELELGEHAHILDGRTAVLFFPESSIRTRVTFEKGIHQLGGQTILFPPSALDKKEAIRDVAGYLGNWADLAVVRHNHITLMEELAAADRFPVINALSDCNHPCEMLSDLYALNRLGRDILRERYLYVGASGNIGLAWKEASRLLGFSLTQCCPVGYEMDGIPVVHNIEEAMADQDIILTDSLSPDKLEEFRPFQVTSALMDRAHTGALLNPCPPFFRGEEVSLEVIDSDYFVGYQFKKSLLTIQQAAILSCLTR